METRWSELKPEIKEKIVDINHNEGSLIYTFTIKNEKLVYKIDIIAKNLIEAEQGLQEMIETEGFRTRSEEGEYNVVENEQQWDELEPWIRKKILFAVKTNDENPIYAFGFQTEKNEDSKDIYSSIYPIKICASDLINAEKRLQKLMYDPMPIAHLQEAVKKIKKLEIGNLKMDNTRAYLYDYKIYVEKYKDERIVRIAGNTYEDVERHLWHLFGNFQVISRGELGSIHTITPELSKQISTNYNNSMKK